MTPSHNPSLDVLFMPRSIAVIGASSDQRRFGGRPVQYLLEAGFDGSIYPVNPNRTEIQGLRAYPDIAVIDGPIDCAILAVSAEETQAVLSGCAAKGVRSAIIFGAGFAEVGGQGALRQETVLRTARDAGIRVLGPNCMGMFNAYSRFYATFASALEVGVPAPGRIALVSQSGGYGGYVMKHMFSRGLGISQFVTTGNEADVELGEVLEWMAHRPETDVIVVYMEGIRSADSLVRGLQAARMAGKAVVVMKVGRTLEGQVAAASHTAAITGEDGIYDAVFREYGAYRARTTDELLDVAYAASKRQLPKGPRTGVISISGGIGVQIADFIGDAKLDLAATPQEVQRGLQTLVPYCSPKNPIDMTGQVTTDHAIMFDTLDLVLGSNAFDAVIIFLGITGVAPSMAAGLRTAIGKALAKHPSKLIFVSITASEESIKDYDAAGLFVFEDPSRAVNALAALNYFNRAFSRTPREVTKAKRVEPGLLLEDFNEARAKLLLRMLGVASPRETIAGSPEEAAAAAAAIGFPVAVKVVSPDILHKSDCGGVALGLESAEAVSAAVHLMMQKVPQAHPQARIDGYLIGEMVTGGVECILGVHQDVAFGPIVTL
jgi:acyl-CoA synthetase (NDP forming)